MGLRVCRWQVRQGIGDVVRTRGQEGLLAEGVGGGQGRRGDRGEEVSADNRLGKGWKDWGGGSVCSGGRCGCGGDSDGWDNVVGWEFNIAVIVAVAVAIGVGAGVGIAETVMRPTTAAGTGG